jgi:hypothetical protein
MDPLSVAASIAGLVAISGKLTSILSTIVADVRNVPRTVPSALSEIKATNATITTLQNLIDSITSTSMSRRALIGLDPLLVTLSETVLIFGKLDCLISPFMNSSQMSLWSRIRWIRNEGNIAHAVEQLQIHKNSMLLMLNILQW